MESTGFRWIPPESGYSVGFCWSPVIPLDSTRVQWTSSVEKVRTDSADSARICWFPVDSAGLLQTPPRINMLIWPLSHQDIPGFDSNGFQEFLGGVYSPMETRSTML